MNWTFKEAGEFGLKLKSSYAIALELLGHSSEIRGLRSTKCSSKTLQN